MRGGYGIFYSSYEAGPLSIPNPGNNPPFFEQTNYQSGQFVQPNPIVSNLSQGFPSNALTNPALPSLFSLDPHFSNPYVQHWQFSVQQELGWNTVWEVAYAGSKGTQLYEFRNGNPVQPSADPNANYADLRPRPYLGDLTYLVRLQQLALPFLANQDREALLERPEFSDGIHLRQVHRRDLHGFARIPRRRIARNWNHPEWEKGPSDFDQKYRFVNSLSYTLPFGKGKHFLERMNGAGECSLGGWELQGIQSYH